MDGLLLRIKDLVTALFPNRAALTNKPIVIVTISSEINVLVVGVMLVVFVVGAPEGILGLWRRYVLRRQLPTKDGP